MRGLIVAARSSSTIFSAKRWHRGNLDQLPTLLRGLQRMATKRFYWRRSIWLWFPDPAQSVRQQWNSLSDHLFSDYPLPVFLHNAWLEDDPAASQQGLHTLIAVGRGRAKEDPALPVKLTRSFSKRFFVAPDHLSLAQAIRWAQLRTEGASLELTQFLLPLIPELPIAHPNPDVERFWIEAMRFVIREFGTAPVKEIYRQDLGELLQFSYDLKFAPSGRMLGLRAEHLLPLSPGFSFRGRTLRSLRRLKSNWRTILADAIAQLGARHLAAADQAHAWTATSLHPYFSDDQRRCHPGTWSISELLTPNELRIEGSILGHCVGNGQYAKQCKKRTISIWSLRKWTPKSSHHVVTIEVNNSAQTIVMALGKRNSRPQSEAWTMIRNWASQEKLKLHGNAPT